MSKEHQLKVRFRLLTSASATVSEPNDMDSYCGVSGSGSAASEYAQRKADAGLRRLGSSVGATYGLTEHWPPATMSTPESCWRRFATMNSKPPDEAPTPICNV